MKLINKEVSQTPPTKPIKKLVTLLLLLLASCNSTCNQSGQGIIKDVHIKEVHKSFALAHLNDYSFSTNGIKYIDTSDIRPLYYCIGAGGGGVIKHIGVFENSFQQDVFTLDVPDIDSVNTGEIQNVFLLSKARAKNQKLLAAYQLRANKGIEKYISLISRPHSEQHTDLGTALNSLVVPTLNQKNLDGFIKYLLITSDMLDTKVRKGKMQPVLLDDVTVLLVRPALSMDSLKALFPQSPVYVFTSASDAILFISNNQHQ